MNLINWRWPCVHTCVCLFDGRFRLKLISFRLLMKQKKEWKKQQTKAEKTVHSQGELRSKSGRLSQKITFDEQKLHFFVNNFFFSSYRIKPQKLRLAGYLTQEKSVGEEFTFQKLPNKFWWKLRFLPHVCMLCISEDFHISFQGFSDSELDSMHQWVKNHCLCVQLFEQFAHVYTLWMHIDTHPHIRCSDGNISFFCALSKSIHDS